MHRHGTPAELEARLRADYPDTPGLPRVYMQMLPWQMAALYALTRERCQHGGKILEIGTGLGGSAWMMSQAAPTAQIVTLTMSGEQAELARGFLKKMGGPRVDVQQISSAGYLAMHRDMLWDLIYVDGDHKRCAADLPWFNQLTELGLILFHDYSPRAIPPVYAAVNALGATLGRDPDVQLLDSSLIGMAGFYRRKGEVWLG